MAGEAAPTPDTGAMVGRALEENLCARCFGRLFARLGTGFDNAERGNALAHWHKATGGGGDVHAMDVLVDGWKEAGSPEHIPVSAAECSLCEGLMDELDGMTDAVAEELEGFEWDTFLMGSRYDQDLLDRQDALWGRVGPALSEHVKLEINREIGKKTAACFGKDVDFDRPDVTVLLDTRFDHVTLRRSATFFYGSYLKLERGLPQTRWPCRVCSGVGCRRCDFRGWQYEESVQELIAAPFMEASGARDNAFHGMGREDVDALMLGGGRPFVLELTEPLKRRLDLGALEEEVNRRWEGRVGVRGLRPAEPREVAAVKEAKPDKSYRAKVRFSQSVSDEKLKMVEMAFAGTPLEQRTPERVSHRRADLVRERTVRSLKATLTGPTEALLEVRAESGTYIKELISGDGGRTRPSVSGLLGIACQVVELDVTAIHLEDAGPQAGGDAGGAGGP